LSGLLKTAGIESTRLIGQMIQIETDDEEDIINIIKENSQYPENKQISYQNGKRYVKRWEELSEVEYSQDTYLKQEGVYLITGGAGGLGLLFAEDIIKKAKGSRIILIGRSPLNNEKKARLEKIRKTENIQYKQVDVTDKDMVDKLIKQIKQEYGRLDGIIHSAGIIKDNYIIKKTEEEIKQVMQPKVTGLINLDLLTKDIPLDFFILFSSISGVVGNLGQADYAAANAYMDAYAEYRNQLVEEGYRKGHTLAINWPMWKNGGMKIDEETEKMMEKNMGMTAMENRTGIEAFYKGLVLDKDQVMVIEGNSEKIRQKINTLINSPLAKTKTAVSSIDKMSNVYVIEETVNEIQDIEYIEEIDDTNIEIETIANKIKTTLKQMVSKLLQVKMQDIDVDTKLNEYGFDSITFTEFANKLNQKYNLELTPTIFFEYSTIHELTHYLVTDYRNLLIDQLGEEATTKGIRKNQEKLVVKQESNINNNKRFIQRKKQVLSAEDKKQMLQEVKKQVEVSEEIKKEKEEIAVVGISGTFPKARDLEEFWDSLEREKDCITEIPKERWDWKAYYGDPKKEKNKTNIKWGGFIDGIDEFDPMFFSISPKEAMLMDPQQRLLMMYVWKVIEDAGYSAMKLSGTKTGIFVGTGSTGYNQIILKADVPIEGYTSTGTVPSIGPNRMSYYLDIHGPSEPIETACSSSLVAIHRAVMAIQNGSCDMAIAGGVNTMITPDAHIGFSKAGMLSEDGRCKTFSDKADGYARGEGAGMIMLKRLKDAEEEGDHIYGIIKGTAENHGGRANSLTAPNPKAQAELIKTAYEKAGINPRTVTYIEAHGTGTELGDPIEINGLKAAFKEMYEASKNNQIEDSRCGIGSVKTNIGHLELAAGIAGVIKVLLQMKHKTLVKSLHCETINPYIKLEGSPFYIVNKAEEWKTIKDEKGMEIPRRAGISSFGFGGVNAHVLIEEYKPKQKEEKIQKNMETQAMIILSAKTKEQLKERAKQLLHTIKTEQMKEDDLQRIAYTLQVGREPMEERLGIIVKTLDELKERLNDYIEGKESEFFTGESKRNKETLAILANNEEIQEAVEKWIKKKKYKMLIDLWTKGLYVDWNVLYKDYRPQKISLPSYPFAKKRYWVTKLNQKKDRHEEIRIENNNINIIKKPKQICLSSLSDTNTLQSNTTKKEVSKISLIDNHESITRINEKIKEETIKETNEEKIKETIETQINKDSLIKELKVTLSEVLCMEYDDIDTDERFIDIGVDSIIGIEWMQKINKKYNTEIAATKIYDYPTINKFADFLKNKISKLTDNMTLHELVKKVKQGTIDVDEAEGLFYDSTNNQE
ncbi:SDR family NAD(P)-dependent oxidoreductase, partial [Vallitalea guaymasensis]|uniref:SDR family NAD(P)-dependent oxidoreductase n=1 Tax=Vallitalea guaymasensis TaxID=1185412 RepID=UPI002353A905